MSRPVVAVCASKDCARDRRDDHRALLDALGGEVDIVRTSCLKVCHGPVVVVDPLGARPVAVEKVRKRKRRDGVLALARGGDVPAALKGRVVTGKARRKAVSRAAGAAAKRRSR